MTYNEFGSERLYEVLKIYERSGWCAYLGDDDKLSRAFDNSLYILGAFDGDALVGFVRCVGDGEHIVYVQDMIVDVPYQRRGIGRELLRRVMNKYADVRMFTLITDAEDRDSRAFYEAVGLTSYDETGTAGYARWK